jgi:transglutaminase-like putative cysteine protease
MNVLPAVKRSLKIFSPRQRAVLWGMASVFFLASVWFIKATVFQNTETTDNPPAVYELSRQVRYGFTIQNTSDQLVENGVFYAWAPVKQTSTQLCKRINASHPFRITTDELGNQMLRFEMHDFPPFGTRLITITADLMMAQAPNILGPIDRKAWLDPSRYVESDDPDLKKAVRSLKAETHQKTAKTIFNWVTRNVQYSGYSKKDRGALYAFSYKKGDCTEYMYLFTALCRAGDIPARGIRGYAAPDSSVLNPAAFHDWVEFYDNGRWHTVDAQNNIFMQGGHKLVAMQIITTHTDHPEMQFNRFRVEGVGLKAKMNG